ncbi:MAG: glycosyltransferase family 39 protein, partial [Candidatus Binatia bacterium]
TRIWILLAVLTRVAAAIILGDRLHFIDEAIYLDAARSLLAGAGYGTGYANVPAHPVFLALLLGPAMGQLVLVRCLHAVVTGVLGGWALHALGCRMVGAAAARMALVFWALDPLVVVAGGLLYPEAIGAVVLTATLLAFVTAAQDDRAPAAALAGVLLGLTVLLRPVAVVLVPVLALWLAFAAGAPRVRRARHAALLLATCTLTIAPWVLTNLARDGRVVPAGMAGLQAAPVARGEINRTGLAASLGGAIWRRPLVMARRTIGELGHFWELYPTRLQTDEPGQRASMHAHDTRLPADPSFAPSLRNTVSAVTFGSELALALVGLAIGWQRRRAMVVLLVGVALVYGFGYALFIAKLRYRIVVLPGVFLLAGVGATAALAMARGRHRGGAETAVG